MNTDQLLAVHGSLMFVGWAVLIPLGAYVAIFERNKLHENWTLIHQSLMLTALGLISIAYIIAFSTMNSHVDKIHKIIGHALFVWLIIQIIMGIYVHRNKGKTHSSTNRIHRVSGSLLIVCGLVNLGIGLAEHRWAGQTIAIAYGLYCVSLFVIFLWAQLHKELKRQGHLDPLCHGPPSSPKRPDK